MKRARLVAVAMASAVLLVGACGKGSGALDDQIQLVAGTAESNGAPPNTGDFTAPAGGPPPAAGPPAQMAEQWVAMKKGSASGLGPVVVNGSGLTLYRFDRDSNNPPTSNCSGACAQTWPKLLVGQDSKLFLGQGIDENAVGSIPSGDGTYQITLGGWPVYRYAEDHARGQANGQGVQGTWFAIAPNGAKANGGGGTTSTGYGGTGSGSNTDGSGSNSNGSGSNGSGSYGSGSYGSGSTGDNRSGGNSGSSATDGHNGDHRTDDRHRNGN